MDPAFTPLINLGVGGAIAAVLIGLHREALRAFREDMKATRESHERTITNLLQSDQEQRELTRQAFAAALEAISERHAENVNRLDQILEHVRRGG